MRTKIHDVFTTGEAARVSGVTHRTVDFWARSRLLVPSVAEAKGMGRTRLYSFDDLVALRVARELRNAGISTQKLRRVVNYLRKQGCPSPLANCRLVAVGKDVCFAKTCRDLQRLFRTTGQEMFAFMIDFEGAVKDVKEQIQLLRAA